MSPHFCRQSSSNYNAAFLKFETEGKSSVNSKNDIQRREGDDDKKPLVKEKHVKAHEDTAFPYPPPPQFDNSCEIITDEQGESWVAAAFKRKAFQTAQAPRAVVDLIKHKGPQDNDGPPVSPGHKHDPNSVVDRLHGLSDDSTVGIVQLLRTKTLKDSGQKRSVEEQYKHHFGNHYLRECYRLGEWDKYVELKNLLR